MEALKTIAVTAEETLFRNEENGYTVLSVREGRSRVCAVGIMPPIAEGERLSILGDWVEHPVYGRQIRVQSVRIEKPTTEAAIERYLGSGLIKGIGPATAKQIVSRFGADTLDVMAINPERLLDIPGIGAKRAQMINESYQEHYRQREIMLFLQQYQISPALATKIYKRYGDDAKQILQENPYRLTDDVEGIGFRTADQIAASMGIERTSEYRIGSGLRYVINSAAAAGGHCYLPKAELVNASVRILECPPEMIESGLDSLILSHTVKAEIIESEEGEEIAIYDPRMYEAETEVAAMLIRLLEAGPRGMAISETLLRKTIETMEREEGITFHDTQRDAIRLAVNAGVCVITGGPGTGKTTIIKCILQLLGADETVLAAPTGRAAKRMSEACGVEAKTIHRLLEYNGESSRFARCKEHPLEAEAVIVDEMSMVDLFLIRSLLFAVQPGTRVILVGDADQLPSVGAGNVLRDILDSHAVPAVSLSEIFRQEESSMIVYNAHRINLGYPPRLNAKGSDFFFERTKTAGEATQVIMELCSERLPSYLKLNEPLQEIQVLAPSKKGECGVWELNRRLQQCFNPPSPGKTEKQLHDTVYRVGDKVMQTRNNYDMTWRKENLFGWEEGQGVFNGDIGYITEIDAEAETITVLYDGCREAVYSYMDTEDLDLAYCISIHKSQGSEFPVVIMPVVGGPPMLLNRSLFYTAVTRAKNMVVLVGKETVIDQMIRNNEVRRRYTALRMRIQKMAHSAEK